MPIPPTDLFLFTTITASFGLHDFTLGAERYIYSNSAIFSHLMCPLLLHKQTGSGTFKSQRWQKCGQTKHSMCVPTFCQFYGHKVHSFGRDVCKPRMCSVGTRRDVGVEFSQEQRNHNVQWMRNAVQKQRKSCMREVQSVLCVPACHVLQPPGNCALCAGMSG